jgi:hypothetical protein
VDRPQAPFEKQRVIFDLGHAASKAIAADQERGVLGPLVAIHLAKKFVSLTRIGRHLQDDAANDMARHRQPLQGRRRKR